MSVSILAFEGFSVHLIGAGIRTPGFYKMPEGTTLQEVIARGDRLMPYANIRQIALRRQVETEDTNSPGYEEQIIDYSRFLLENTAESNPVLKVNDEVIIPILTDEQRRGEIVTILGTVSDQGSHLIGEPRCLSDLLLLAGRPEAAADFSRVRIFDLTQEKLTSHVIDFEPFLSEAELSANPYIPPGRLTYIPQILPLCHRKYRSQSCVNCQYGRIRLYKAGDRKRGSGSWVLRSQMRNVQQLMENSSKELYEFRQEKKLAPSSSSDSAGQTSLLDLLGDYYTDLRATSDRIQITQSHLDELDAQLAETKAKIQSSESIPTTDMLTYDVTRLGSVKLSKTLN